MVIDSRRGEAGGCCASDDVVVGRRLILKVRIAIVLSVYISATTPSVFIYAFENRASCKAGHERSDT